VEGQLDLREQKQELVELALLQELMELPIQEEEVQEQQEQHFQL
jgi:hypothetical protein